MLRNGKSEHDPAAFSTKPGHKCSDTIPISYIFFVRTPGPNSELSRMNGGPQHMSKRVRQSTYPCRPDDKQQSTTLVTKEIF